MIVYSSWHENQLKKTISTKKIPLWCKYFHISACTLTYWHINCNLVRFIWFYFCAIRCFLFGRFYFSLIFFFALSSDFNVNTMKFNSIDFGEPFLLVERGYQLYPRREQVQRFDSNVLNNWQCTTNPEFSTPFIYARMQWMCVCVLVENKAQDFLIVSNVDQYKSTVSKKKVMLILDDGLFRPRRPVFTEWVFLLSRSP